MSTYATYDQLVARLGPGYTAPSAADSAKLLASASELIDYETQGYAETVWADEDDTRQTSITNATCDQVEYWLEVGAEHDVVGLQGSLIAGRVQVQNLPPRLGRKARQQLLRSGVLWRGAGVGL